MSNNRTRNDSGNRGKNRTVYAPPSRLDIPKDLEDHFIEKNMGLRWVRYRARSESDLSQVSKRKKEGYIFVTQEEVAEFMGMLGLEVDKTTGFVTNGDLALAKVPLDLRESRKDYYEGMARAHERAVMKDLDKSNSRTMPIFNDSRSFSRTGRQAEFSE